jgi:hypothetical protein
MGNRSIIDGLEAIQALEHLPREVILADVQEISERRRIYKTDKNIGFQGGNKG